MKKTFRLKNLGCAHCASKMEHSIKKLPGITGANLAFMTQRLTIEAQDENFDDIIKQVEKIIKRIEPSCRLVV